MLPGGLRHEFSRPGRRTLVHLQFRVPGLGCGHLCRHNRLGKPVSVRLPLLRHFLHRRCYHRRPQFAYGLVANVSTVRRWPQSERPSKLARGGRTSGRQQQPGSGVVHRLHQPAGYGGHGPAMCAQDLFPIGHDVRDPFVHRDGYCFKHQEREQITDCLLH